MPIDETEAIVLRTYPIGDQDKIVVLFTRERGVVRGVAKGARKFGNRFGSSLEPMSLVRAVFYEKERKDLITLNSCDLVESFFDMQKELRTSFTLSYFAEIIEEFSPARAKDEILYRLLLSTLRCLKDKGDLNFLARYFEAWFLRINGFLPDLSKCKECRKRMEAPGWLSPKRDGILCEACAPQKKDAIIPEVSRFLDWIRKNPPPSDSTLPFSAAELDAVKKTLQSLIVFHLEREPKTLRYIKD